ncbi:MAG: glycosyltransferase family 4 protein, partial [Acetivibrionales bacterium]
MPINRFNDVTHQRNQKFNTRAMPLKTESEGIPEPEIKSGTRCLKDGRILENRSAQGARGKRIIALMSNIGCGGAEIHSISLFNGLCKKGFEIKVLVLDTERIQLAVRLDERIEKEFIARRRYFDLSAFMQVKKQIDSFKPDVFIMVDSYPILYGRILRFLGLKVRSIVILHNTEAVSLKRELQNRLIYAPSINKLDRIVFVSENQQKFWINKYKIDKNKASVILNGIALENYDSYLNANDKQNCRKKLGIPADRIVIVMNASLWLHKNHDHMIEAIHRLKKQGYDLFLLIVGDGPR